MMHFLRDSFYRRLLITLLLAFMAVAVLFVVVLRSTSQLSQQEITQRIHKNLAEHVVAENQFFFEGRAYVNAAKNAFMHMMVLGPAFEFYLLDKAGNILAYSADPGKVKLKSIDLKPVQQFVVNSEDLSLPLLGTDPRSLTSKKIFSAAEIIQAGELQGYLYVIVGDEIADAAAASVLKGQPIITAISIMLSGILFSLLAALAVVALLTRPLRQLARDVEVFKTRGLDAGQLPLHKWDPEAGNDIQRLGSAFSGLAASLREQYAKVKSVDDLRKELMAHVSHDLRTPLASLRGYLETWLLKHEQLSTAESIQYIETAHNNAKKINVLVDQLFELAHLDSESVQVTYETVAIAELVQDVLQKFQLEAEAKGVTVEVEPKDPSLTVQADIEKLERVFTNLIENAIRHCEPGDTVKVQLVPEKGCISVRVMDSGIGIPSTDLPYIFDAHYKAANSVRGDSAHGGLGLAIVKKLLDLHDSHIQVVSQESSGTTFCFDLLAA